MSTESRLESYGVFVPEVVATVSEVADQQNQYSFQDLADTYGVADGAQRYTSPRHNRSIEYLRILPKVDYAHDDVRIYFTPMATPIDENIAMRCMRMFATMPNKPLYVFGAPAGIGNNANLLLRQDVVPVWDGNFSLVNRDILRFLDSQKVNDFDIMGYSFGAERAIALTETAFAGEFEVNHLAISEPVSVTKRSLLTLLRDFISAGAKLQKYVDDSESMALIEARKNSDIGMARYFGGLLRASNIAITHAISMGRFEERMTKALKMSEANATVIWGGKSELVDDEATGRAVNILQETFGDQRVRPLRIPNMHHAGGDDIDLHAAMMLQSVIY